MKEDKNKSGDLVEKWLHQTVGNFQPEAPDNTWERLIPHLPKRKKRRFILFWWIPSGIAAALFVTVFLRTGEDNFNSGSQPAQSPTTTNANNSDVQHQKTVAGITAGITPASTGMLPEQQHNRDTNKSIAETGHSRSSKQLTPTENVVVIPKSGVEYPILSHVQQSSGINLLEKPFLIIPFSTQPKAGVVKSVLNIQPNRIHQKRIRIGFDAAPAVILQKIGSENVSGLVFPEIPAHPGTGWQAGVSFGFQLRKNWWLSTGIQHFQQTHQARHQATLRLMDGILLNPNDPGLKEYEFQYAVISSGRPSELTLRLQQQVAGATMPADEPFTLDMKTTRHSTSWRIPLTVERQFGAKKWRVFLRGGAMIDFKGRNSVKVTHFTEICQDLCFATGHIPRVQASAAGRNTIGWIAGAGIERQVSPRTVFRIEPFFVGQKHNLQSSLNLGIQFTY